MARRGVARRGVARRSPGRVGLLSVSVVGARPPLETDGHPEDVVDLVQGAGSAVQSL